MFKSLALVLVLLSLNLSFPALSASKKEASPTPTTFAKNMQHAPGFFDFYYDNQTDKVYLEIRNFDQQFLFQSSMPHGIGSNDIGLDRGQLGETRLVKFERYGNKVMLKQLNTAYRAGSNNAAEQASIDEAFADSVIAGFSVVASDDKSVLIDYSDFLFSDIHGISERLSATKQGTYKADPKRSGVFLKRSKSFVDNTELEALVTFAGIKAGKYVKQVAPDPSSISVHLHHSLVRLPDDHYQTRAFTPFSGYWSVSYQDYSVPIEQSMTTQIIPRHRLSKKDKSAASSEAIEPIVYYLDPGIPEPIKGALHDGALWWNQAFTAIGYKDAFQVKVLPQGADPMDVRYNVIQWVHRATRGWSYGSSVTDPRSGEIIKGHVTLGSLRVRQDYLIALGLSSPFGQDNADTSAQKEMALARIRQLSAHEVGHTLGIAHNFAASEYGRESVMDYPHPKLSIVDGKISFKDAYDTGMGDWDRYVIAYGYQDYVSKAEESAGLQALVQKSRDQGMTYQSDPDARPTHAANSNGHLWDNGKDPVDELNHLSRVRQLALQNFGLATLQKGQSLSTLEETLAPIYLLHRYQLDAVAKLIGGINYEYELKGDYEQAKGVTLVPKKQQEQALDALLNTMTPEFLALPDSLTRLITPKAYGESRNRESFQGRTGLSFDPMSAAESAAAYTLQVLLNAQRLNRVAQQQDGKNNMGLADIFESLFAQRVKLSRRSSQLAARLQYLVVDRVVVSLDQEALAPEVRSEILSQLVELRSWLTNKSRNPHNLILAQQLTRYFEEGHWPERFKPMPLPPGSPI